MYAPFFGLRQAPFSIAPDPRFLFMSAMHREALAHLLYGLGAGGGFVLLTGEIGAGKTTLCRCFLEQVPASHAVAYIYNPRLTVPELLLTICQEFGVAPGSDGETTSIKSCIDALNAFMLAAHAGGRNCVLIIDEAQNLAPDVLEQLRLLTNLETAERKLLQIILIGQPELRGQLAAPALAPLAQRIVARYHVGALTAAETADYIRHRLAVAGQTGTLPFDAGTLGLVHRLTGGVPRRINLLCDRALLGAYSRAATKVDRRMLRQAAREVSGDDGARPPAPAAVALGAALVSTALLVALVVALLLWHRGPGQAQSARAASLPAPAVSAAVSVAATPMSAPLAARMAAEGPVVTLGQASLGDEAAAWPLLAQRWNVRLPVDWPGTRDACQNARTLGLACHRGHADLAALRQLDRPVILTLPAAAGRPTGYAVLQSLGEQTATLRTTTGTHQVQLDELVAAWGGDYATLWRPPEGYREPSIDRAASPAGEWLLAQLERLQGDAPALKALAADETLRRRVFAFQVQHGLLADGLAGPLTLMHLNRAVGVGEPQLSEPR